MTFLQVATCSIKSQLFEPDSEQDPETKRHNGVLWNPCESSRFGVLTGTDATFQTITDLDDFLTPSQACIIPVRNAKKAGDELDDGPVSHIFIFGIASFTSLTNWTH